MPANHLEQLVSEWYEYQGYFIRRNVRVGKLSKGGYAGELDVVAFHPKTGHVLHIEPSLDTMSWEEREKRYIRKFEAGRKYIPSLLEGFVYAPRIDQVALLAYASKQAHHELGGGRIMLASELFEEIMQGLKGKKIANEIVDEQFPLLRTLHYVVEYRNVLFGK